jgi:hypothetical protein
VKEQHPEVERQFEVSAKSGENVEDSFREICKLLIRKAKVDKDE